MAAEEDDNYYGKVDPKKEAMRTAVYNLGKKKATLTEAKNKLIQTCLKDHPDVQKVIELLTKERERLNHVCAFD